MQKPTISRDGSLPSSLLIVPEPVTYKLCIMVQQGLKNPGFLKSPTHRVLLGFLGFTGLFWVF